MTSRTTAAAALPIDALARRCDTAALAFATTDELDDLPATLGQERAVTALRFGVGVRNGSFHIFALGPPGVGKKAVIDDFLRAQAAGEAVPPDWCYVHNFAEPHLPRALRLPPGTGVRLRRDMEHLVEELRAAIPSALEGDAFRSRHDAIAEALKQRQEALFEELQGEATKQGVAVVRTPVGFSIVPVRDGEPIRPDAFEALPEAERTRIQHLLEAFQERLAGVLRQMPALEQKRRAEVRALVREMITQVVDHLIAGVRDAYPDLAAVAAYLDAVRDDVVENAQLFQRGQGDGESPLADARGDDGALRRYRVNVLVDHGAATGAPVVHEDFPSHANLAGRIEHIPRLGALVTDFTLIKAGALHRANGGYLVLDARKVLLQPFAWEGLKRTLRARQIRMESVEQMLSLVSTVSLEPEPVPLDVKVVLLGDALLYYLLSAYDPDFPELFKVPADFAGDLDRSDANTALFARLIASLQRREGVRALDREAVARVIDHAARAADDAHKLSLHHRTLADLLHEADYWAAQQGRGVIGAADVQQALDAQIHRADRVRERVLEDIRRGTLLVATDGAAVGQVNGLAVVRLGGFSFGFPSRITARTRLGRGEVVDIEREVDLGGPIHSKGMLILQGFLGARYAADRPLTLHASLVFEQSYGGVDGDSAAAAELFALLSSLADVPLRQSVAVTGSIDQHGRVQPIGGVNEKVEGFFDACRQGGLTGGQGVLIPSANVQHLMLRPDVVAACAKGRFHVWAMATVDEGIERLTGVPAGARDATGHFPPGTLNRRVEDRLLRLAEAARAFARDERGHGRGHDGDRP
ncbi:Lon protease family protein [Azospirillum sp. ST 5-10]|uniref:Lon protease family protein n=1 Tax=unclassified Azospirillum TaxID=2630922 RepID=UPI003F49C13E